MIADHVQDARKTAAMERYSNPTNSNKEILTGLRSFLDNIAKSISDHNKMNQSVTEARDAVKQRDEKLQRDLQMLES